MDYTALAKKRAKALCEALDIGKPTQEELDRFNEIPDCLRRQAHLLCISKGSWTEGLDRVDEIAVEVIKKEFGE